MTGERAKDEPFITGNFKLNNYFILNMDEIFRTPIIREL